MKETKCHFKAVPRTCCVAVISFENTQFLPQVRCVNCPFGSRETVLMLRSSLQTAQLLQKKDFYSKSCSSYKKRITCFGLLVLFGFVDRKGSSSGRNCDLKEWTFWLDSCASSKRFSWCCFEGSGRAAALASCSVASRLSSYRVVDRECCLAILVSIL